MQYSKKLLQTEKVTENTRNNKKKGTDRPGSQGLRKHEMNNIKLGDEGKNKDISTFARFLLLYVSLYTM